VCVCVRVCVQDVKLAGYMLAQQALGAADEALVEHQFGNVLIRAWGSVTVSTTAYSYQIKSNHLFAQLLRNKRMLTVYTRKPS